MGNADEMAVNRRARANDENAGDAAGSASAGQPTWDASTGTVDDGVRQTVAGSERVAGPQAQPKETGNVKGADGLSPTAGDDDSIDVLTTGGTGGAAEPKGREGAFEGAGSSYGDADALVDDDDKG